MAITQKHKRKILALFRNIMGLIRQKSRISVKQIQKLLGLQIWISTVFRVAREFLTSSCDVIRAVGHKAYFNTRKNEQLVNRLVFDLSF